MAVTKRKQDAAILLPTYNEAENIEPLLGQIFGLPCDLSVIVLDDRSPDGTGEIVSRLCSQYPRLALLSNAKKEGLGAAYLRGFRYVLENADAEFVFQMDADFSHDPSLVPQFIAAARERGLDLVIGSRYIRGGGTPDWDLKRNILSRSANLYCRILLGTDIHDYTTGFRCYRAEALRRLDLSDILSDGYGFQIETAVLARKHGLRIGEIPIVFFDRKLGASKLGGGIINEAFFLVLKMAMQRLW
jgi:dolichol-phosphate mannosyltransferase